MSPNQVIFIILGTLVTMAIIAAIWVVARRAALRTRFGPEYDQVVADRESRGVAERELRERARRHAELTLTPLSEESRRRYAADWSEIQARFVEAPSDSVTAADELVTRLMAERGYPTGNYDDQLAHLSVEHGRTLSHYREAHDIHLRDQRGEAGTEELRQALVHYRALFADLLGADPVRPDQPDARPEAPARAEPDPRPAEPDTRPRTPRHAPQPVPRPRPQDAQSR
jgi:hypothetical protein